MKKMNFNFSTKLTFDDYVSEHSLALRCIPIESERQRILSCDLQITPFISTNRTIDAFGNNVVSGYIKKEHRFLDFEISGRAEIDSARPRTDIMPCYRYQSRITKPDSALLEFYTDAKTSGTPYEKTVNFSEKLSEIMTYEKDTTTVNTTAAEAFAQKKGVCQDFSHIVLSLLRTENIPCRYIAGLASCDGETHAWIEVWDGEKWIGYDPTNCCDVSDDYLILSQGRDYSDCAIDRGVMIGKYTRQMQLVSSKLYSEIY